MPRAWGSNRAECERIDALLEGYLDGDLVLAERSAVERHLDSCATCGAELELAESVSLGLRSLPVLERCAPAKAAANAAPSTREADAWPSAVHGVEVAETTRVEPGQTPDAASPGLWTHPLLQAAAVLLLLSGAWFAFSDAPFAGSDRPAATSMGETAYTESAEYTVAEIQAAEEDLRVALSYFGSLAEKAGVAVRDDVLRERVVAPTSRAFQRIGDFGFDGQGLGGQGSASRRAGPDTPRDDVER